MSARAHVPGAAKLLAHLNLLLMLVGGACLWQGTEMLREGPPLYMKLLPPDIRGTAQQLWTGAGGALVALGAAHWLLAHLAVVAATSPSAALFVFHAVLTLAVCLGEGGWLGWSVTALHAVPAPADRVIALVHPCLGLIFSLFFPGHGARLKVAISVAPELVYLTYSAALGLLVLQLMSCVAALCAAWGSRSPRIVFRDAARSCVWEVDASAPPLYR